jgi:hypothetical protein
MTLVGRRGQLHGAGTGSCADQFRGYTVLGMFFVDFVGGLAVIPAVFKHHNTYCSYADTIRNAPQSSL